MPGPELEPQSLLAPQFVDQLRTEYRRHVRNQLAEGFCRCGEVFPCDTRNVIAGRIVSAGYKPEPSLLDQRLRLADELYLISHDDRSGKQLRPTRVVGTGLGGALLAELMLGGNVRIRSGNMVALHGPAPLDEVAWNALQQIMAEQDYLPVRTWIQYLSQEATRSVAQRLGQQQILLPQHTSNARAAVRWKPTDWIASSWRTGRLRKLLEERQPMELPDIVLIELAIGIGLDGQIFDALGPRAQIHRQTQAGHLPDEFRALAAITKEVAEVALLNH